MLSESRIAKMLKIYSPYKELCIQSSIINDINKYLNLFKTLVRRAKPFNAHGIIYATIHKAPLIFRLQTFKNRIFMSLCHKLLFQPILVPDLRHWWQKFKVQYVIERKNKKNKNMSLFFYQNKLPNFDVHIVVYFRQIKRCLWNHRLLKLFDYI